MKPVILGAVYVSLTGKKSGIKRQGNGFQKVASSNGNQVMAIKYEQGLPIEAPLHAYKNLRALAGIATASAGLGLAYKPFKRLCKNLLQRRDEDAGLRPAVGKKLKDELALRLTSLDSELLPEDLRDALSEETTDNKEKKASLSESISSLLADKQYLWARNPFSSKQRGIISDLLSAKNKDSIFYSPSSVKGIKGLAERLSYAVAEHPRLTAIAAVPAAVTAALLPGIVTRHVGEALSDKLKHEKRINQKYDSSKENYDKALAELASYDKSASIQKTAGVYDTLARLGLAGSALYGGLKLKDSIQWLTGAGRGIKIDAPKGGNPLTQPSNIALAVALGIPLAAGTYGIIRGVDSGFEDRVKEFNTAETLEEAWKLQQKRRDYDYTPIGVTFDDEDFGKRKKKKSEDK